MTTPSSTSLPAVASNFYYLCKKCNEDRFHKVLTHPTPESAQLQCEVCGKKSTFKPKAIAAKAAKAEKTAKAAATPGVGRGVRAAANSAAKKASAYAQEYDDLKKQMNEANAIAYKMSVTFKNHQTVSHPKFGIGLVKSVQGDKIEVYFKDEARLLVHSRPS